MKMKWLTQKTNVLNVGLNGKSTDSYFNLCRLRRFIKLTIPEIRRIGSFPDDFKFIGTFKEKWARIGNSVPPNLMRAIAEHIKSNILKQL